MATKSRSSPSIRGKLRSTSWYGLKPFIARILQMPVVNAPLRTAAKALPEDVRHRLPVSAPEAEYRLSSGESAYLLRPQVDQIAKDLVWGKGKPTSAAERRILEIVESRSRSIDLFLDIGAYSCLFSLIALRANPQVRAIAFEVLPENFLLCSANVIRNDLVGRLDVRLCGIGDRESSILMPLQTGSAANPTSVSLSADFQEGVSVPVTRLDSLELSGRMLWKVDVEGHELAVFEGARETLSRCRPTIICEVLKSFSHAEELRAILQPLGYRFYLALPGGLEEQGSIVPDARARDWLFEATDHR